MIQPKTYYGSEAVQKVKDREGDLTHAMRRVIEEEGFVDGIYEDHKGIKTAYVGQTGVWINKTFKESFEYHKQEALRMVPGLENYPEYLQAELIQATYRGDLQMSPTFRKYLNNKKYMSASVEFLDHKEYKNPKTPKSIKKRLEKVSNAVEKFANERAVLEERLNKLLRWITWLLKKI
jgi:hypothetical protein